MTTKRRNMWQNRIHWQKKYLLLLLTLEVSRVQVFVHYVIFPIFVCFVLSTYAAELSYICEQKMVNNSNLYIASLDIVDLF